MILAPSLDINLATSAPTPRAAPVQIATLPSSMPAIEPFLPPSRRSVDPAASDFVNSAASLLPLRSAGNQQPTGRTRQPYPRSPNPWFDALWHRILAKLAAMCGLRFEI